MNESPVEAFHRAQAEVLARAGVAAEDHFVRVPSLKGDAHVLRSGEGPPIVLLNGIGTPAVMWAPLMRFLDGFQLNAVDLPGYGLTVPPPARPADLRAHAVTFIEEVLDGLGLGRPSFVGNSLGSLWTVWAAMDRPERVGPTAHVGCPALAVGSSAPLPMRLLSGRVLGAILTRVERPSPAQVKRISKLVNQHPLSPEIAEAILATELMPGFDQTFHWNLNALLRLRGASPRYALTDSQLQRLSQRSLLIFSRHDPMGAELLGRRMAKALPASELRICDGGHCPWLNDPERIAGWIGEFLRSVDVRS